MKWLDRWFAKKLKQAWDEAIEQPVESNKTYGGPGGPKIRIGRLEKAVSDGSSVRFDTRPMTFNVYSANGGWAVEYNYYDRDKDISTTRLHVVPADKDLGESLGKIVNYEVLMK